MSSSGPSKNTALDECSAFFSEAVTLSAAMTTKTPGVGQAYLGIRKDKENEAYFDRSWVLPDLVRVM